MNPTDASKLQWKREKDELEFIHWRIGIHVLFDVFNWAFFGVKMKPNDLLESLPAIEIKWPCLNCGNEEFVSCNTDENGNVTDCAKCKDKVIQ